MITKIIQKPTESCGRSKKYHFIQSHKTATKTLEQRFLATNGNQIMIDYIEIAEIQHTNSFIINSRKKTHMYCMYTCVPYIITNKLLSPRA